MLEELVGSTWHRFITKRAVKHYPEAIVYLDDMRHIAGIFFRALGGEAGLRVENATDSEVKARRSILQRIAGVGDKTQYTWRDEETLRLPESIAIFPSRQLNRDLYLWLTALSVIDVTEGNWISRNQYRTKKTLAVWPGLTNHYQRLLKAHLQQRLNPLDLPAREAKQEAMIRHALSNSSEIVALTYAKHPPATSLALVAPISTSNRI